MKIAVKGFFFYRVATNEMYNSEVYLLQFLLSIINLSLFPCLKVKFNRDDSNFTWPSDCDPCVASALGWTTYILSFNFVSVF